MNLLPHSGGAHSMLSRALLTNEDLNVSMTLKVHDLSTREVRNPILEQECLKNDSLFIL